MIESSHESASYGIPDRVWARMGEVFARAPSVERVILYGSRAKGNYREGSDIDLTLEGPSATYQDLLTISVQLDDLDLPWMIDLSLLHRISNDTLREHIARVGKVVYTRQGA